MSIDTSTHVPPPASLTPADGPTDAPGIAAAPPAGADLNADDIAEGNRRMREALQDGFDPSSQLADADLDVEELVALQSAVRKLDPQEHRQTILDFQLLFLEILRQLKQSNREQAQHARAMMEKVADQSFDKLMEAAQKEYEASLTQGIGQIVTGGVQAKFSMGSEQTAVLRGQAAGSASSGIASTLAAGEQHDAAAARAEAALHDKDREVLQGDVQRAQENAADANEALSNTTHALDDQLKVEAELHKTIARSGS